MVGERGVAGPGYRASRSGPQLATVIRSRMAKLRGPRP